jgi:LacI family transcriptional regulator
VATEAYAGELVYGALAAAAERGHLLFVCETGDDPEVEERLVGELVDRHVDAFLYATAFTREVELPKGLRSQRVALLNCRAPGCDLPSVLPDEHEAGRAAATALLEAGHREGIWVVGEPADRVIAAAQRLRGVREVLAEADLALAGVVDAMWWPESAYEEFGAFLDGGGRPSAVICLNDRVAMGVYQALGARRRSVPADVSVVSFDDSDLASWLQPPLSSIALPHRALATEAVRILLGTAELSRYEVLVPMPVRLRQSIGSPGRAAPG